MAKRKVGRPKGTKIFSDPEKQRQLEALLKLKPTLNDCAGFFKCDRDTISDFIKDEYGYTFDEYRERCMSHTRFALVRQALEQAKGGNTTMLIFCLKNLCHWSDNNIQPLDASNVQIFLDGKKV